MLKAGLALLVTAVWTAPACADGLLVGIVRDQDGILVSGAAVDALDSAGRRLAGTATGADGTFALEAPAHPAALTITCRYCRPQRLAVPASDAPIVVAVRRAAILRDGGLSAEDLRVLPYSRPVDAAGLLPLTGRAGYGISDRGLARGHAGTVVAGLPAYRLADGFDLSQLLAPHAAGAIEAVGPTGTGVGRASGGTFAFDPLANPAESGRIESGLPRAALLRLDGPAAITVDTGTGDDGTARSAAIAQTVRTPALALRVGAAAASAGAGSFVGTSLDASRTFDRFTASASLAAVRSIAAAGTESDALAALVVRRGPISAGLRALRTTAVGSNSGAESDTRAFVALDRDDGPRTFHAALALARGSADVGAGAASTTALLPELVAGYALGPAWAVRAGLVDGSTEPTFGLVATAPAFVPDRTHLLETALTFDDGRALRVELSAFRQPVGGTRAGVVGGSGISVAWQIAPAVALRAWRLVSRQSGSVADRSVLWLTLGTRTRFDLIDQGGALDGDLAVPLGTRTALVVGTHRGETGRVSSIGLTLR